MLNGKIALVTGGTRGIGLAIARTLAKEGAHVALLFSGNDQAAKDAVSELTALGVRAVAEKCDISNSAQVNEAVKSIRETLGSIDILVNNAGITRDKLSMRMSDEDFSRVIGVNLNGAFYAIRAVMPDFVRRRSGRIVNITSVAGLMGNPGQANYAAAKAGLVGLTKTIARELAPRGITVNAVAPGFIETDMTRAMDETLLQNAVKTVPLKRMGQAQEIADAVCFLASDKASYITGAVLQVDGGLYM